MKRVSLYELQLISKIAALIVVVIFAVFFGYLYYTFNRVVTGDIKLEEVPSLLSTLHQKKVDDAAKRFENRKSLPDVPPDLPNPYRAPSP